MSTIRSGAVLNYVDAMSYELQVGKLREQMYGTSNYTTLASGITATAVAILGWNLQPTASSTSNPIASQTHPNILASSPANGYRMSRGVKAGIGASVGVGMLMVIILFAWVIILRRKNRNLLAETKIKKESSTQSRSCELCNSHNHELGDESWRELDNSQINELSHRDLYELNSITVPAEMSVATPKTLTAQ